MGRKKMQVTGALTEKTVREMFAAEDEARTKEKAGKDFGKILAALKRLAIAAQTIIELDPHTGAPTHEEWQELESAIEEAAPIAGLCRICRVQKATAHDSITKDGLCDDCASDFADSLV